MRDRLIELTTERLNSNIQILKCHNEKHIPVLNITNGRKHEIELIDEIYEDVSLILEKIKNNILIELPCKVGDVVYQVTRDFISQFRVRFIEISICENLFLHTDLISGIIYTGEVFPESEIGKTVFLTKEEAEQALKGGDNNA